MYQDDTYSYTMFERFFFEKNLQGDIVAVYNEFGEKIGSYYYDAWGNHTVVTESGNNSFEDEIVNNYNPFRYRGYYYDVETGFYYLQSRYYNPEWGRFLNADVYVSTGQGLLGNNMYAYCNNNPVMYVDFKGELAIFMAVGALLLSVGVGIAANHLHRNNQSKQIDTELQEWYTQEEAQKEIEQILSQYIDNPVFGFGKNNFFIQDSYKVTKRFDRLKICEIVRRTGVTNRTAENMAAEWLAHNFAYHTSIDKLKDNSKDVNIDYIQDHRKSVRWSTKFLELIGGA